MQDVGLPAPAADVLGQKCPVCQGDLAPLVCLDELEQVIVNEYPHMIALPFKLLHEQKQIYSQQKSLVDVLTNILKYLALITEAEYLQSDHRDEGLNEIITRDLGRPAVGHWNKFLREGLSSMQSSNHEFFVTHLPDFYYSIELKKRAPKVSALGKGYYDEDGEFQTTKSDLTLVGALINYRNKFAHGFNQPEKESRKEYNYYYDLLKQLLEKMDWTRQYPMFKRQDGRIYRIMGSEMSEASEDIPFEALETSMTLGGPQGEYMPLTPFFLVPKEFVAKTGEDEELLIYDQNTGKRIVYVSPQGHHRELQEPVGKWQEMFKAKKDVPEPLLPEMITPEAMAERCRLVTKENNRSLYSTGKIIKDLYLPRKQIESQLVGWPDSCYPLAAVSASAGSGKTCLFHHLAQRWEQEGKCVLFLRAQYLQEDDLESVLRSQLYLSDEVKVAHLAHGTSREKPLLIVIDGINEHPKRDRFMDSIVHFGREMKSQPIKVIFSYRLGNEDWLDVQGDDLDSIFYSSTDLKPGKFPAVALSALEPNEVKGMWERYAKSDKKRYKPKFSYDELESANRTMIDLLRNPLLLRLFLEVYSQKPLPPKLTRHDLFGEYWSQVSERTGDQGRFLEDLGRIFLERRSSVLDLDYLYRDSLTREVVMKTDVTSPYLKLKKAGVLVEIVESDNTRVTFVVEAFMDHVLGRVLCVDGKAETPKQLAETFSRQKDFAPVRRACEVALHMKINEQDRDFLYNFIDTDVEEGQMVAGVVLGQLVKEANNPAEIGEELVAEPTVNDLRTASEAGRFLEKELKYSKAASFFKAIVGNPKAILNGSIEMANIHGMLGRNLRKTKELPSALENEQRAMEIRTELYPEDHPDIAQGYINLGNVHCELEHYSESIGMFSKAESILMGIPGPDRENAAIAQVYSDLGKVYSLKKMHKEAFEYKHKAAKIRERVLGGNHPKTAETYNNLANSYSIVGERELAAKYYTKSLEIKEHVFGAMHPEVALAYYNFGGFYMEEKPEKSLDYFGKTLEIYHKIYAEESVKEISKQKLYALIGRLHKETGNRKLAVEYYRKAAEIERKLGNDEGVKRWQAKVEEFESELESELQSNNLSGG
jgi:tetratricopeptide (TPR) repeat protein